MRKDLLGKTLVMGVILLFIGVGIQPAFAVSPVEPTDIGNEEIETFYNGDITRDKIIEIAEAYVNHEWYPTEENIYHGYCRHCSKWVDTPDSDYHPEGWVSGETNIGVPYQWGGFSSLSGLNLSSEVDFDEQYTGTGEYAGIIHYAGDIHCEYIKCSRACGVDCSGFVSRCWNLSVKKSTSSLPGISNQIKYEYLKPGDILDKPGYHVILFKEFVNDEKTLIRTIEANWPKVFENIYSAEISQDGYSVTLNGGTTYQIYSYEEIPNSKPNAPTINGPTSGKPEQTLTFTFNAVDPDGDDVSYFIEWGDGTSDGWTPYNPSGHYITVSHTWEEKNPLNTIAVKAKDIYGHESDWTVRLVPISSSISINDNNEVKHETTVRIHRARGITPYTLKLTEKESDEVDRIFDNLKVSLYTAVTDEEIDEIYDNAVVSLYELGMFPRMTIKEAKQLVTSEENFNCRIAGETTETYMFDLDKPFWNKWVEFWRNFGPPGPWPYWTRVNFLRYYKGKIGHISFGYISNYQNGYIEYFPSHGWVWTKGSNGKIKWEGALWGNIKRRFVTDDPFFAVWEAVYLGVKNFEGVFIDRKGPFSVPPCYLGNAEHVRLTYNQPPPPWG